AARTAAGNTPSREGRPETRAQHRHPRTRGQGPERRADPVGTARLAALLSALSGVPLNQGIAVTGASAQRGAGGRGRDAQGQRVLRPVPGTRTDGRARGDGAGGQRQEPDAEGGGRRGGAGGTFPFLGVSHIDEGIELLMERVAGERAADGTFPEGTVHRLGPDPLREDTGQGPQVWNVSPGPPSLADA